MEQLSGEWKKPTTEELQPMSRTTRAIWAQFELLQLKEGVLYLQSSGSSSSTKQRMVLPRSLVKKALNEVHDGPAGAHLGRMKTLKKISARFWRPGLTKEVHRYCDGCLPCAKFKSRPTPRAPLQSFPSGNPMQRIHIDIVGPLPRTRRGNRYILTVQYSFTKWTVYHPEGNGQVENIHKTLKSMLKARVEEKPKSWDEHLDHCMMAYRSSVHASTGHTPFELMFGREMRIPLDVMMVVAEDSDCMYSEFVADLQKNLEDACEDVRQNLKVAQRCQKDAYDKGVKHTVYQAGKFHRKWDGPFKIIARVTEVTYRVRKVAGRSRRSNVVHFNNLRLYQRRQEETVDPVDDEGGEHMQPVPEGGEEMVVSTDGEESELMDGECELSMQHPATPEMCGPQPDNVVHPGCVENEAEHDHSVEAPGTEDGDLVVDTQTDAAIPQEGNSRTVPANLIGQEEGSERTDERAELETAFQSQRRV